jgi:hypothetical protein
MTQVKKIMKKMMRWWLEESHPQISKRSKTAIVLSMRLHLLEAINSTFLTKQQLE